MVAQHTTASASSTTVEIGTDTRSRDAFEILQLGEAVFQLQREQRKLRLAAEEMRFERDRYRASAEAFQGKLAEALAENSRLRDLREALRALAADGSDASERDRLIQSLHNSELQRNTLQGEHERLLEEMTSSRAQAVQDQQILLDIAQDLISQLISARSMNKK